MYPRYHRSGSRVLLADCENDLELINLWLALKASSTVRGYKLYIRLFLAFVEGKSLEKVTINDLTNYILTLEHQGYKRDTIRHRVSTVKSLLSFGHSIGYLPYNIGELVNTPKPLAVLGSKYIPESTILLIINSARSLRDKLILKFLYQVGCRVSELCALKWYDLQERDYGGQVNIFGKGEKIRFVPISRALWNDLMEFKGETKAWKPIFPTKNGKHFDPRNVRDIIYRICKKLDIPRISPHSFRHAHASHSLERGAKIHLVAETLGHSSIAITGQYLHARPNESSGFYLPEFD